MALSEEVAWVTGSSTGIGRAVAVALAEGGRRVVVHYNASED
jgi:3-oxoacyl-[acyl-carrier protein] reductase